MRKSGIPVECWMLPIEGKRILDELFPNLNNDFKFNSRWHNYKSWMKRNNFSIRVVTNTNKACKKEQGRNNRQEQSRKHCGFTTYWPLKNVAKIAIRDYHGMDYYVFDIFSPALSGRYVYTA